MDKKKNRNAINGKPKKMTQQQIHEAWDKYLNGKWEVSDHVSYNLEKALSELTIIDYGPGTSNFENTAELACGEENDDQDYGQAMKLLFMVENDNDTSDVKES